MLVSDRRRLSGRTFASLAREAALAGIDWIQVREKDLPGRELRDLVAEVVEAARGSSTRVIVNGRADVALAAGAQGVQLPEGGLPVAEIKRAFPGLLVGASRHSVEATRRAADEGADLVVLGPIFSTPGKEDRALGLEPLGEASRSIAVPIYAIGGIDAESAPRALAAGARGLAAIRAFLESPPREAVAALKGKEAR
jgi:thiamine-phosphate pyrophosphorylase